MQTVCQMNHSSEPGLTIAGVSSNLSHYLSSGLLGAGVGISTRVAGLTSDAVIAATVGKLVLDCTLLPLQPIHSSRSRS